MSLGILLPGQGSQHPRMLDLLDNNESAWRILLQVERILKKDIHSLINSRYESCQNEKAQPILCATEMATWFALKPYLPTPKIFAGYSVGELAAYGCAESISPNELIKLACKRAWYMDHSCSIPTELLAVKGISYSQIQKLSYRHGFEIAIINDTDHFIIGVKKKHSDNLKKSVSDFGANITSLSVNIASHTPWLETAAKKFRKSLELANLNNLKIPVLAGINGLPVFSREKIIVSLAQQICTTIDWSSCMRSLVEYGCTVLLEIGPGNGLAQMARKNLSNIPVRSVADFRSFQGVADWVNKCF